MRALEAKWCRNAVDKYIPFGLFYSIPNDWNCNWKGKADFA